MKQNVLVMSQSTALGGLELGPMTQDIRLMRHLGWEVVLALRVWPELSEWVERLRRSGVQVVDYAPPLFLSTWDPWRARRLKKLWGRRAFTKLMTQHAPDGIICYSSSRADCLAHLSYAKPYEIPAILSVHQVYGPKPLDPWLKKHIREALSSVRGLHCVSRDAAQGFMQTFGDLLPPGLTPTVIYNSIDVDYFRPPTEEERAQARAGLGVSPHAFVIGTVCRLEPMKGVLPLLETFVRLSLVHPDLYLVFVGDGSQRKELDRIARTARVTDRVRFLGHCDDVRPALWGMDIFALFSKHEGFGLATLEASSVGLPVVATDVPGTREVVRNGETAMLFPYGDWAEATRVINNLIKAPETRSAIGHSGWAHVERLGGPRRREEKMTEFFAKVFGVERHSGRATSFAQDGNRP